MTNKEKLRLLVEGKCTWCRKQYNLSNEHTSRKYFKSESSDAILFDRNSCSTYFYSNTTMGTYSRFDNEDEAKILEFLDDVIWIGKEKDGPATWCEPVVKTEVSLYYLIENRYYHESFIHDAIKTCIMNKELEQGEIIIKNKKYTIDELEKVIELIEQIKSL